MEKSHRENQELTHTNARIPKQQNLFSACMSVPEKQTLPVVVIPRSQSLSAFEDTYVLIVFWDIDKEHMMTLYILSKQ